VASEAAVCGPPPAPPLAQEKFGRIGQGDYSRSYISAGLATDTKEPLMFICERCESRYNATVAAASSDCPRCKESEGIATPLRFRLFEPSALKVAGLSPARPAAPVSRSQPAK
jgi:hypothetical protein